MYFLKQAYTENRFVIKEALCFCTFAIITTVASIYFDLAEVFFEFSRRYEELELDEIFLSFGFISSFYLMLFALRRMTETRLLLRTVYTDSLAEVYNRKKCRKSLKIEVSLSGKFGKPLTVTLFDLDHFKMINDEYGQALGDYVIKTVSGLIKNEIRNADTLFRIEGERFLILSKETDESGAVRLAERLRSMIEKYPFRKIGSVTASFGVAAFKNGDDSDSLLKRAERKLNEAKESGRNMVLY